MMFAKRGHDVTVATGFAAPGETGSCPDGVRVYRFQTSGNGRWLRGGGYQGDIQGYQRFIREFEGDAVFCHCWQTWSTDLAVPMLAGLRARKILVSHGVTVTHLDPTIRSLANLVLWRPYVWRMPKMLRAFDHLVLLSGINRQDQFYDHFLAERHGFNNWSVIPNGTYVEQFSDISSRSLQFRRVHAIGSAPLVLNVSNYHDMKNQASAIRAFVAAGHRDATLVLIGGQINDYARHIQQMYRAIAPAGLPRVIFLEKQSREAIVSAYCAADLFVCPSKWELQPLVILDAMAAGVPFVTADVGCVSDFPGGMVVRGEADMASKIAQLLADSQLRRRLGQAGRLAAESLYNWDAVGEQYEALLSRLCS